MRKIKDIITGWFNWMFKDKADWMITRKKVCKQCPSYKRGFCGECGCLINAKVTLSTSYCPLSKWSTMESQEDLINSILGDS